MFWKQFVKLCSDNSETPTSVVQKLGFSSSNVTYWKKDHMPQAAALHKIAEYFDVTVEYLLGKEEKPSPAKTDAAPANLDILTAFNNASPAIQDAVRKLLDL